MLPVVAQLVEAAQFFAAKHVSRSNSARDPIMTILTIRVSIIGRQGLCSPSSPGGAGRVRRRAGAEAYPKLGEGALNGIRPRATVPPPAQSGAAGNAASPARRPSGTARRSGLSGWSAAATG